MKSQEASQVNLTGFIDDVAGACGIDSRVADPKSQIE